MSDSNPPKPPPSPQRTGNISPRRPLPTSPRAGAEEPSRNRKNRSDSDLFSQHGDFLLPNRPTKRISSATTPRDFSDRFPGSTDAYVNNRQAEENAMTGLQHEARAPWAPAIGNSTLMRDHHWIMPIADGIPTDGIAEVIANRQAFHAPAQARFPVASASIPYPPAGHVQAVGHTLPSVMAGGPPLDPPAPFFYEQPPAPHDYEDARKPAAAKPKTEEQPSHGEATTIMLGWEEDVNWLSTFHCFVRAELVEVCFASEEDIRTRVNMNHQVVVSVNQVGLSCRRCRDSGTLYDGRRAPRSVAFPTTIEQIYQSFTMMSRDHIQNCENVPITLREKFLAMKEGKATHKGTANSKSYWIYSAQKLGMVDSQRGIIMTEESRSAAKLLPPFGSRMTKLEAPVKLVNEADRALAKVAYTFTLLQQVQRVYLLPEECVGNRSTVSSGVPGMACIFCCQVGWMGLCRVFPLKKRFVAGKAEDMYQHLVRCTRCPDHVKEILQSQHSRGLQESKNENELYGLVWERLRNKAWRG